MTLNVALAQRQAALIDDLRQIITRIIPFGRDAPMINETNIDMT
jgi:hypothetical protein